MTMVRSWSAFTLLLVTACARQPEPPARVEAAPPVVSAAPAVSTVQPTAQAGRTLYTCDNGQAVVVQDEGDTVRVSGLPRGEELLGRDAGGLTPQQAVFSGPTLRVELGLDRDGRGMALQSLSPPELAHCRRE